MDYRWTPNPDNPNSAEYGIKARQDHESVTNTGIFDHSKTNASTGSDLPKSIVWGFCLVLTAIFLFGLGLIQL